MKTIIFHNARCQKSRCALELLEEKGVDIEIRNYLEHPPSATELKALLKMLGLPAEKLVRKGEPIYKKLYQDKKLTEAGWIKAMTTHPILIERPIVVKGKKAIIGRPPENVLSL